MPQLPSNIIFSDIISNNCNLHPTIQKQKTWNNNVVPMILMTLILAIHSQPFILGIALCSRLLKCLLHWFPMSLQCRPWDAEYLPVDYRSSNSEMYERDIDCVFCLHVLGNTLRSTIIVLSLLWLFGMNKYRPTFLLKNKICLSKWLVM